ncbi:MAG: IPTL-CTERM sorting domain-containing protein [Thiolinea sp.]
MKKRIKVHLCCLLMCGFYPGISAIAAQLLTPATSNTRYAAPTETVSFTAVYNVSSPQTDTETGIGLRVHYDSSQLTPVNNQLYPTGAQPVGEITDDSEDYDADPQTDKYFVLAWIDLNAQWPGSNTLPLDLFTSDFTVSNTFSGTTRVNLSASGTAQNHGFQTSSQDYCAKPTVFVTSVTSNVGETGATTANFRIKSNTTIPAACGDLAINFDTSGSADAGSDYTAFPATLSIPVGQSSIDVPVSVIDDDEVENDETVIFSLLPDDNYQMTSASTATINISSDDLASTLPVVNLSVAKTTFTEGSSGSLLIYANRTTDDLSAALEVFVQLGGTASVNTDYQPFANSILIPANKDKGFAVLILKDDATNEAEEAVTLSIAANEHYQRGSSSTLQLTITDDEISQNTNLAVDKATPVTSTHNIPTLNEWMLLLTSLLLAGFAALRLNIKHGRGR